MGAFFGFLFVLVTLLFMSWAFVALIKFWVSSFKRATRRPDPSPGPSRAQRRRERTGSTSSETTTNPVSFKNLRRAVELRNFEGTEAAPCFVNDPLLTTMVETLDDATEHGLEWEAPAAGMAVITWPSTADGEFTYGLKVNSHVIIGFDRY